MEARTISMQQELQQRVIVYDYLPQPVRIITKAEVEYNKHSDRIAGVIVLLDTATKEVLEVATHVMAAPFPYVPAPAQQ